MKRTISLSDNYMFRRIYKIGKCSVQPHIAVYYKNNRMNCNRLGITASKKIGNAVQRNRARRLIKESYRLLEDVLPVGFDIVIVARKKAVFAKMQDVGKNLQVALNLKTKRNSL